MGKSGKTHSLRKCVLVAVGVAWAFCVAFALLIYCMGGFTTAIQAAAALIVLAALALAVLYFVLGHYLMRPFSELISDMEDALVKFEVDTGKYSRYTEIYALGNAMNSMLRRVERNYAAAKESEASLDVLKSIANGMDAFLYVSHPDTDEILFINEKMKEHFGIKGDLVGRVCWQVLQSDMQERCSFCPCHQLDKDSGRVIIWEELNTVTGRYYRNNDRYIDWPGIGKAHLQHSVDITDMKKTQFALDKRLRQQELMTAMARSFLSDNDLDTLITDALCMTGEFMNVAHIGYYALSADGSELTCQNEWKNPDMVLNSLIGLNIVLSDDLREVFESLTSEQEYISPDNPLYGETMAPHRKAFDNYITVPVFSKGKMCGVLDFARVDDEIWSRSDINLTTLVSSALSGAFERKWMDEQLRRHSSIVESSTQLIFYITKDGRVDYINPAVAQATGHTMDEAVGREIDIFFDEQTVSSFKEIYIPRALSEGACNFEIEMLYEDETKHFLAVSIFTIELDDFHIGAIARDVTDTRLLEIELIAAKELAELSSQAKSGFLSRMSHEMRTPMNAIIGMTNIARSSDSPARKEYCLERISSASRHLLGVINDVLDMSKIESGKFELSCLEFSLEHMLMSVLDFTGERMEEKHQEFSLYLDPEVPTVLLGDEQRLAQVITNLLANAAKFTPENGKIHMKIDLLSDSGDEATIQVEVADSGIGISQEQQYRLFQSFEQADGGIARKFGGTGLGLAISKSIIEMMGGSIWIESELGCGSKFIFTLKLKKGSQKAFSVLKRQVDVSNIHIMVVDDAPEILEYFEHVMQNMGISCVAVSGGDGAIQAIKDTDRSFDLMFVDWKMPGINGVELARAIRDMQEIHPIIIMISGAEWSEIEQEAKNAGIDGFLPKPLFPSVLMDCINKYVGSLHAEGADGSNSAKAVSFEGKTALLAEDLDINREIIIAMVEDTDLQIVCAENGLEAVEIFGKNPERYDIILMDIHMPEMDGLEATRRIRAMDSAEGKKVPIMAMTADVFSEDVKQCIEAGMNDHIGKPIDFDLFFLKLRKYLG